MAHINVKVVLMYLHIQKVVAAILVVDHVIAIDVTISDSIAMEFANTFYDSVTKSGDTIKQAFDNARGRVAIESQSDCCCNHIGHRQDCFCATCNCYTFGLQHLNIILVN